MSDPSATRALLDRDRLHALRDEDDASPPQASPRMSASSGRRCSAPTSTSSTAPSSKSAAAPSGSAPISRGVLPHHRRRHPREWSGEIRIPLSMPRGRLSRWHIPKGCFGPVRGCDAVVEDRRPPTGEAQRACAAAILRSRGYAVVAVPERQRRLSPAVESSGSLLLQSGVARSSLSRWRSARTGRS